VCAKTEANVIGDFAMEHHVGYGLNNAEAVDPPGRY